MKSYCWEWSSSWSILVSLVGFGGVTGPDGWRICKNMKEYCANNHTHTHQHACNYNINYIPIIQSLSFIIIHYLSILNRFQDHLQCCALMCIHMLCTSSIIIDHHCTSITLVIIYIPRIPSARPTHHPALQRYNQRMFSNSTYWNDLICIVIHAHSAHIIQIHSVYAGLPCCPSPQRCCPSPHLPEFLSMVVWPKHIQTNRIKWREDVRGGLRKCHVDPCGKWQKTDIKTGYEEII